LKLLAAKLFFTAAVKMTLLLYRYIEEEPIFQRLCVTMKKEAALQGQASFFMFFYTQLSLEENYLRHSSPHVTDRFTNSALLQLLQHIGRIMLFRNLGFANTNDKQSNQIGTCMFFLTGI
jgi:hypothetical protein